MSISSSKPLSVPVVKKFNSQPIKRVAAKTNQIIKSRFFNFMLLIIVAITGIGELFGRQFSVYWYVLGIIVTIISGIFEWFEPTKEINIEHRGRDGLKNNF